MNILSSSLFTFIIEVNQGVDIRILFLMSQNKCRLSRETSVFPLCYTMKFKIERRKKETKRDRKTRKNVGMVSVQLEQKERGWSWPRAGLLQRTEGREAVRWARVDLGEGGREP